MAHMYSYILVLKYKRRNIYIPIEYYLFLGAIQWLSLKAFFGHQLQYEPCNQNLYNGMIIFLHKYNTQSTGQN